MYRQQGGRSLLCATLTMVAVVMASVGADAAAPRKTAPGVRNGADDAAIFLQRCKASAALDDRRARAEHGRADTAYCIATIKTAAVAIQNVHEYYRERAKPAPRRGKPPADPATVLGGDSCIPPKTTVHAIYVDTQRYAAAHPEARALTPLALMQRAMAAVHPCAKPVVAEKPVKRRLIRHAKRKR